jgi:hypothetical protein
MLRCILQSIVVLLGSGVFYPAAPRQQATDVRTLRYTIGGDGTVGFHQITGMQFAANGHLYVLDHFNTSIRVFDERGNLVREFGRRGQGPGEFTLATEATVTATEVRVASQQGRVLRYSLDGRYLAQDTAPALAPGSGHTSRTYRLMRGGARLAWLYPRLGCAADIPVAFTEQLVLFRSGTASRDTLGRWPTQMSIWTSNAGPARCHNVVNAPLFTSTFVWNVAGDSLVATVDAGVVRLHSVDAGGARRLWEVNVPMLRPRPVNVAAERANRQRIVAERHGGRAADWPVHVPDRQGTAAEVLIDDQARVWIRVEQEDPRQRWIIVTRIGMLPNSFRFPERFRLLAVKGTAAAGIARDDLDVRTIRVYTLPF